MPNPTRPPDNSLTYRCPRCGAEPGEHCRTRSGRPTPYEHAPRQQLADHPHPPVPNPPREALCCQCGNLRTFKQGRNHRGWFGGNLDWHRQLIDLKCDVCGAITPHAAVGRTVRMDRDEELQDLALGHCSEPGWSRKEILAYASRYRRGNLPRNPYLHHCWWATDAEDVRKAGKREVVALCGEVIELPEKKQGVFGVDGDGDYVQPDEVRDQEYEDPATGLWWRDMECVDCLRAANMDRLKRQRDDLRTELMDVARYIEELTAAEVADLRAHMKRIYDARDPNE